jgi:hypothetical protein
MHIDHTAYGHCGSRMLGWPKSIPRNFFRSDGQDRPSSVHLSLRSLHVPLR